VGLLLLAMLHPAADMTPQQQQQVPCVQPKLLLLAPA
jgi:hypothetical protein